MIGARERFPESVSDDLSLHSRVLQMAPEIRGVNAPPSSPRLKCLQTFQRLVERLSLIQAVANLLLKLRVQDGKSNHVILGTQADRVPSSFGVKRRKVRMDLGGGDSLYSRPCSPSSVKMVAPIVDPRALFFWSEAVEGEDGFWRECQFVFTTMPSFVGKDRGTYL